LAAAGVDIWSTYLGGNYAQFCGTSIACPHITGAVAIMIAKRRIRKLPVKPDLIRDSMAVYAEDLPPAGRDELHGFGVFAFGRVGGSDRPAIDLRFEIGETTYWKNGVVKQAYIAPRIVDDRTLVGLRDVGEALECQVDWVRPYVYIKSL
ncbi:MAG: stalk domain-containing protein, partial [Thermodesulfobacteriota bacterium]|nr:stalk domain-containing protein [Thermodesulfobacteriota bacterium]